MTPTLEKLYAGELRPDLYVPQSEEYLDSQNAFHKSSESLKILLPDIAPKIDHLLDEYRIMSAVEREELFQYGFRVGVRLVIEALS